MSAGPFREAFPILVVGDMARSLAFWRDLMSFAVTYAFPEDAPAFALVAVEGGKVGLALGDGPVQSGSTAIWLYCDDVDAALAPLRDAGVPVVAEPVDQPWGERVASVADADGYTVHLGAATA